jgi:NAD(P)H-nitrite reductase large subunit
MVEPSFAKRSVFNHFEYLDSARIVTSTAVDIANNQVVTADGKLISFDYLVIATGHVELTSITRNIKLAHDRGQQSRDGRLSQYEAGNKTRVFGSATRICGGEEFEFVNGGKKRE